MIEFNSPLNDKERINQLNKQNQMLHPDREPREIAGYLKEKALDSTEINIEKKLSKKFSLIVFCFSYCFV